MSVVSRWRWRLRDLIALGRLRVGRDRRNSCALCTTCPIWVDLDRTKIRSCQADSYSAHYGTGGR